jgi:hypothetical protein
VEQKVKHDPGSAAPLGEPLVDVRTLAAHFGVSERTAEDPSFLRQIGLERIKIGRLVRFDPADVRAALEKARL